MMELKKNWDEAGKETGEIELLSAGRDKPLVVFLEGDRLVVRYSADTPSFAMGRVQPMGPSGAWADDAGPWGTFAGLEELAALIEQDAAAVADAVAQGKPITVLVDPAMVDLRVDDLPAALAKLSREVTGWIGYPSVQLRTLSSDATEVAQEIRAQDGVVFQLVADPAHGSATLDTVTVELEQGTRRAPKLLSPILTHAIALLQKQKASAAAGSRVLVSFPAAPFLNLLSLQEEEILRTLSHRFSA